MKMGITNFNKRNLNVVVKVWLKDEVKLKKISLILKFCYYSKHRKLIDGENKTWMTSRRVETAFCSGHFREDERRRNSEWKGQLEDLWSHRFSSRSRLRGWRICYSKKSVPPARIRRRGDEGATRGRGAAYTRGIPNDFESFGTARRDREGPP